MRTLLLLIAISALCGCRSTKQSMRYAAADGPFGPVIVSHGSEQRCNRVGVVKGGQVDANSPGIYHQQQSFQTAKGKYRNDIYRVHFERIPLGHLSWGRNVGIFVIVTSDAEERPLLVTTVHTCGCYSAVVPTSLLDASMLPEDWRSGPQIIYNERLPRVLELPSDWQNWHPELQLRAGSHRVMDMGSTTAADSLRTLPMDALHNSGFYHETGPLKGYVKGSNKILEQVLMWWTLDPCIGSDKALGPKDEVGAQLYTSIRFWMRDESDLWNFGTWLAHEGWRL
jgi:hypothetical protein